MPRFDVPRPKKSDYWRYMFPFTRKGRYFDQKAYNQAVQNWEEARDKHRREHGNNSVGDRLRRGAAAAGIAATVYSSGSTLPQSGYAPLKDEADSSVRSERDRRSRQQRDATKYKGRRGNTGQSG